MSHPLGQEPPFKEEDADNKDLNESDNMVSCIWWPKNNHLISSNGSSFRGTLETEYGFEETVARIYALSGQEIFQQSDEYKCSFDAIGVFYDCEGQSHVFTLYDWKGSGVVHIGGYGNLPLDELVSALMRELASATPKAYKARIYYDERDGICYEWPAKSI